MGASDVPLAETVVLRVAATRLFGGAPDFLETYCERMKDSAMDADQRQKQYSEWLLRQARTDPGLRRRAREAGAQLDPRKINDSAFEVIFGLPLIVERRNGRDYVSMETAVRWCVQKEFPIPDWWRNGLRDIKLIRQRDYTAVLEKPEWDLLAALRMTFGDIAKTYIKERILNPSGNGGYGWIRDDYAVYTKRKHLEGKPCLPEPEYALLKTPEYHIAMEAIREGTIEAKPGLFPESRQVKATSYLEWFASTGLIVPAPLRVLVPGLTGQPPRQWEGMVLSEHPEAFELAEVSVPTG